MRLFTLTLFATLALFGTAHAQQRVVDAPTPAPRWDATQNRYATPDGQPIIRCHAVERDAALRQQYPHLPSMQEFEEWYQRELPLWEARQAGKTAVVITIPVIVHIIHNGEAVGTGRNISAAQVQSQIDVLNEDFRRMLGTRGYNTHPNGADSEIEFCLAVTDPTNAVLAEPGIHRVNRTTAGFTAPPHTDAYVDATIKPATSWNPNEYMNIWVCDISGGILGWAQFPTSTLGGMPGGAQPANTDGVVIGYQWFGSSDKGSFPVLAAPYDLGRTATHEVGHFLGLRHIWGDGSSCAATDYCGDTPSSDAENFGCPTGHNSCGTPDMIENYMDYTNDACMDIFTTCQKTRMQFVLANSPRRATLGSSTRCQAPAPFITFATTSITTTEATTTGTTGCRGYTDHNVTVQIALPPTGAATVTFGVAGGATATAGLDYDIITPTVTFPNGNGASRTFTLRVYNDWVQEATENLTITMSLGGGTNAQIGASNNTVAFTINNRDVLPGTGSTVLLNENFETTTGTNLPAGWAKFISASFPNNWYSGVAVNEANAASAIQGTRSLFISNGQTSGGNLRNRYSNTAAGNGYAVVSTGLINATGLSNIQVSFRYRSNGELNAGTYYDYGRLLYSTDGTNYATVVGSPYFQGVTAATAYSFTLPASFNNSQFYLAWGWFSDNSVQGQPPFIIDEVVVQTTGAATQIANQVGDAATNYLGPNQEVYFYDASGDILAILTNTSAHNYGCTTVEVDRAGTGAVAFQNGNPQNGITAKTIRITPATNNPTGAYAARLYWTEAEIAGWEAATGNARTAGLLLKTGGPISAVTPGNPNANGATNYWGAGTTRGTFQTTVGYWYQANFTTGFSGFGAGDGGGTTLPVELLSFTGRLDETQHPHLDWQAQCVSSACAYTLQESADGQLFAPVYTANSSASNSMQGFSYTGPTPLDAPTYYRLAMQDAEGALRLSPIVELRPNGTTPSLGVFPNPAHGNVRVRFAGLGAASTVRIINATGQVVHQTVLPPAQAGEVRFDIQTLAPGLYTVVAQGAHGTLHQPLVVQ